MLEWAARQRVYEETTATDAYRDAARRPGESLAVYAFRLAALFEDAYPEADKQREMQAIFAGFSRQQLVVYLDDLLLMESSFSGHLQLVDAVLSALEAHGITLNTSKCHWFQPEVKFLGHQLSAAGLRKAPEYIEKVQSFPRPQTVQELRRFLGLVNFQRKFVPRCSEVARPLSELTGQSGSTALTWTPEMTDSFEQLKNEITRDVMLAFPDYSDTANPLCLWALVHLHSLRLINHRVARTVEELAAYDMEIRHVPGRLNAAADMLSRVGAPDGAPPAPETPADTGLPPGLILSHRPEGGGDSLVECLCEWMSTNALQPAVNRELRAKLIDEALRSPGRYGLKLDRSVRQALRLMRLPGQPLAVELLAVFACLFDVRVLVHFGPDHPMTFCSARHSKRGNIHLHCLAGIHFNLLAETGALDEQNAVLSAYIVNEERARDGSDQGLSRRHSAEAQGKNLQSEAEETRGPACGHLFSSRCSAAAICNGQAACALLDSGAAVSLCSADSLGRLGFRDSDVRRSNVALQGLAGLTFGTEYVEAEVALSPEMKTVRVPLVIERSSSFGHCLLLGVNFLHEAGAIIDVERREVTCGNRVSPLLEQQHVPDGDALVGLTQVQRVPELPAVREHQQHNRAIRSLAHHVRRKTSRAMLPRSLRHFRKHWDRVAMVEGLVVYQFDEHRHVPVVSRDWLVELVGTMHEESAHAGRDKLIDMVTQQVFCPGAANIVADVVGACRKCQLFKPSSHVKTPPTIRITASAPFELIEADLVMLPRSGRGHIGCLVVVDHASKFGIAVPIRSKSSPAVATAFEQRVLPALLRPAARCLTDNGGEFCGAEFEAVLERWGIVHILSTPLRAQGHGAVERLNRTLGQSLRMLDGAPGDWDLRLPRAVSAYNSTLHSELGVSPAQYLLGRAHEISDVPRVPLTTQRTWSPGHPSFAPFRVGEQVKKAIERPGNLLASKLGPRYAGPLTVTRVNDNGVTYEVSDQRGHSQRAHHAQLRPWKNPPAYIQRASPRVRRLFHWTNDEPEPPDEAERTASVNLHVPCGLVPHPPQSFDGAARGTHPAQCSQLGATGKRPTAGRAPAAPTLVTSE
ncbi:Retrovirus-related Pol polyprotein from transposon 17.6 [Amphibalanus amphitrite]|uniref:RNA-directed DNA polymerase n=1 Tax=Amphibalanus amphitrite TaxID=1232801 RepID=A0A6A4VUW9_AMPAM|nr:Retrovirus-related Pol polyprotein from transposon 17.6 [Amphibalanus amphitrite]